MTKHALHHRPRRGHTVRARPRGGPAARPVHRRRRALALDVLGDAAHGCRRSQHSNPIGDVRLLWLATWLLQVMPVFFLVGGYSNLASWEAARRDGRGARSFLVGRWRRLARPTAALVAVWAVLDALLRLARITDTSVLHWGIVVFVPLWFLGVYAGVVALAPVRRGSTAGPAR